MQDEITQFSAYKLEDNRMIWYDSCSLMMVIDILWCIMVSLPSMIRLRSIQLTRNNRLLSWYRGCKATSLVNIGIWQTDRPSTFCTVSEQNVKVRPELDLIGTNMWLLDKFSVHFDLDKKKSQICHIWWQFCPIGCHIRHSRCKVKCKREICGCTATPPVTACHRWPES